MSHATRSASLDVMFDVLSHSYRRRILVAVSKLDPRDGGASPHSMLDPEDANGGLEKLNTALFHTHLPKLAEKGFIEWDRDGETVRRGPNFEEIAPLIDLMVDHEDELPADWP